jgi:coiled-coil domain-containing protein 55
MKLSFSLAKPKTSAPPLAVSRPSAFGNADDDDAIDSPSTLPSSSSKASVKKAVLPQNVKTSKTMRKKMEAEKQVDETVYEYDEIWDKMQEAKLKAKMAKESESKERKVSNFCQVE